MADLNLLAQKIKDNIKKIIIGKDEVIDLMLIALFCEGHVLIEDVPGVGKTSLAYAMARSAGCSFKRIQFTPDVLPSDVTGFTMPNMKTGEFEFRPGMIMSQVILADEINRTAPKTQSALLEAMEERQVTVDGVTYPVPRPFMVMATQNPVEYIGTYPLPEAQLDRFFMRISLGYPSPNQEVEIMTAYLSEDPKASLEAVAETDEILSAQQHVRTIRCAEEIKQYISNLVYRSRLNEHLTLGASPRGSISLMRASQGAAFLAGRDYVIPDDVQLTAIPVLAHRLVLKPEARLKEMTAARVVQNILNVIRVPVI